MERYPTKRRVLEGAFTQEQLESYNSDAYNIYFLPNYPSQYSGGTIDGSQIDTFEYVFVDFDLKDGKYPDKDAFISAVGGLRIAPSRVVDSGGGIHVFWRVSDLDAISYLKLSRRMMRALNTDEAVGQIYQLMRAPGTMNVKIEDDPRLCEVLLENPVTYTCEQLDKALPPLTKTDEEHCLQHFDKTYGLAPETKVDDRIPPKFAQLVKNSQEAKDIWSGNVEDRSKGDYRLGHIMFAHGFTWEEAMSVLVNSAKALARGPAHRVSYAENIVDKIWTFEVKKDKSVNLSPTVRQLLSRGDEDTVLGTRFPCNRLIDDTVHGFRLGQVMGVVGGSGVGKTTLTLNAFLWFAYNNPDYHHFFFSLEQPPGEIAARIKNICQDNDGLYDKIHIVSNYEEDGTYKHLTLTDMEEHLLSFQESTGHKVGATVIDHIGVIAKDAKNGENDGLIGLCRGMKAFAQRVNTFLMMLSQAPREKAGIGDLELDKSAAYGTVFFESFVDYFLCLWQPLKRMYADGAPTVMAIKFAKIRHKKQGKDKIQEDVCYQLRFDPDSERIREMTQEEETSAKFFVQKATNARKLDRRTDVVTYNSRKVS